ncbi:MAG: ABC transporter permease subunit [Aigarchaeota archaeon]|nr:ABC transporter permease subunit [Aigarchaeota archaeon]MDW8092710.1 ABC transporter permease subunit [Nitrososphaerota archaeon]
MAEWKNLRKIEATVTTFIILALLWQLSSNFMPYYLVPPLDRIFNEIMIALTRQYPHLISTLYRVLIGLVVAFSVGFILGILMGIFRRVESRVIPLVHFINGIPALSWILIIIIWLAETEARIITILMMINLPIFVYNTLDGVKGIPREPYTMVYSFRPTRRQLFMKLILPSVIPNVLTAWKAAIGLSVRVVLIAELVGATTGIGYMMFVNQSTFNMGGIIAWTLVLVGIALMLEYVIGRAESRFLGWRLAPTG